MKIVSKFTAPDQMDITCTIAAEDVKKQFDQSYRAETRKLAVPGFRKGHVPAAVVRKMISEEYVMDSALTRLINNSINDILMSIPTDLVKFGQKFEHDKFVPGEDLEVTLDAEVQPLPELGQYKGLTIKAGRRTITDADVDEKIEQDRNRLMSEEDITDRAAQDDDVVYIDFEGTVDGKPFEGNSAKNHRLTLGTGAMIAGFEEGIVGMQIGEERDLELKFPENYREDLAGKDVHFTVHLNNIVKVNLPELDDDFAADVSDFDTFDEYKANVRKTLEEEAVRESEESAYNQLIGKVEQDSKYTFKDTVMKMRMQSEEAEVSRSFQMMGFPLETYLSASKMSLAQFRSLEIAPRAQGRLMYELLAEAIIEKESLKVTEDDLKAELTKEHASEEDFDVDKAFSELTPVRKLGLTDKALFNVLHDFMMENNTIEYVDPMDLEDEADGKTEDGGEAKSEEADKTSEES